MIELVDVTKQYDYTVLDHISIRFPDTGLVIISGESGCGKSTLLQMIGGLDQDYQGQILFLQQDIRKIRHYIKKYIGFIFQNIYLIDDMTVKDNAMLSSYFKKTRKKAKKFLLNKLDLMSIYHEKAAILSGGEKQRTAIMRTFLADNQVILCDEPTGSLDQENSEEVFSLLQDLAQDRLVIVVSHDVDLAEKYGQYLYRLQNGKLKLMKHKKYQLRKTKKLQKKKSFLYLVIRFFRLSIKSNVLLVQVICVVIISILLTLTLMNASHQQIQKKIEQIIPSTTIVCKKKNNQDISINDIRLFDQDYILYRCMEYSDIELMGLSFENKYHSNKIFYIADYSQNLKNDVVKGKMFQNDNEIVLSKNTYDDLCLYFGQQSLINKKINLIFQSSQKSNAFTVTVTGVTDHETALPTIYLREYAYSHFCQELFSIKGGQMCLLQVKKAKNLKELKHDYPLYDFQIANIGLTSEVDEKIHQIESILFAFSLLLSVSACFLMGEIFYLNVIKRKKLFAIFKSFGATSLQISVLVLVQGLIIGIAAFLQAVMILKKVIEILNQFLDEFIMSSTDTVFVIDESMLITIFIISLFLMIVCCLIPVIKANKIDIIEGLKG